MEISGRNKWAILLLTIVALEAIPGPTLSGAHFEAVLNPKVRIPVLIVHLYLVCHLWKLMPERYDPLRNLDKIKLARNPSKC